MRMYIYIYKHVYNYKYVMINTIPSKPCPSYWGPNVRAALNPEPCKPK